MNIFDVIREPKMTEKTLSLKEDYNQFAFSVDPRANKIQIKESIEKSFKVSVLKVRVMNVRGDKKRLGRHQGYKSSWKKALVTLKAGETIEFFEGA
tara:strand:- start:979 stop:1266 length:288 start_codon:yes stop_codon:yes gene_type:complete